MSKKKSNGRFHAITLSLAGVVSVLAIAATVGMNLFPATMDNYLGRGESYKVDNADVSSWDTNYYDKKYSSDEERLETGKKLATEIAKEGDILLKNNGVLPLSNHTTVMPFGYAYSHPFLGQPDAWGSGKSTISPYTLSQALSEHFTIDSATTDIMDNAKVQTIDAAEGTRYAHGKWNGTVGTDCYLREFDPTIYQSLTSTSNTGFVIISRAGEEASDLKTDAYADGTRHYLALSENEKGTIKEAKRICSKVVVLVLSSQVMELSDLATEGGEYEADAILWLGSPSENGLRALGDLLDGTSCPSGKTVDTFPTDLLQDPSLQNFGEFYYTNTDGTQGDPYLEYQEGMYMGYRYYETANDIHADGFTYGSLKSNGAIDTKGQVVYPFGYGLSYTTFSQEFLSLTEDSEEVTAKVKVTNTGSVKGKDVAEIYTTSPYTEYDIQSKIEKPTVALQAFAKTEELAPGESQELTLSFKKEDLASYCYTRDNGDGTTGCYILEKGDYIVSLRTDSHSIVDSKSFTMSSASYYDNSNIRKSEKEAQSQLDDEGNSIGLHQNHSVDKNASFKAATNLYQTSSDYMNEVSTNLTRSDWNNSFPNGSSKTKALPEKYQKLIDDFKNFDYETDPLLGNVEGSKVYCAEEPTNSEKNGVVLSDLRGKDFNDPLWDTLLDQINYKRDKANINRLFSGACYMTKSITSLGMMDTVETDGANGIKVSSEGMDCTTTFPYEPIVAATYNVTLAEKFGMALGDDALAKGVSGLYSPAMNLHRTPFNGRNFEYFSEDPLLSGKMGAAEVSGAASKGLATFIKHFALNDNETNRDNACHAFCNEQAMRELYFRPYEITIKEAKTQIKYISDNKGTVSTKTIRAASGVMAAQNCVGIPYGHCNYAMLTEMLRGEWGFQGSVITDWFDTADSSRDMTLRAGSDLYLSVGTIKLSDFESPTARSVMRQAIHRIGYTFANSNATNGVAPGSTLLYKTSPWVIYLTIGDIIASVVVLALIVWNILRAIHQKKHPEDYQTGETI